MNGWKSNNSTNDNLMMFYSIAEIWKKEKIKNWIFFKKNLRRQTAFLHFN
jgi:hypothetical protein